MLKLPGLQLRQRVGLTEGGVVVRGIRDGRELDVELRHERVRTAQDDAALRFFGARARFARVRDSGLPAFVSIGERGGTLFAITSAPVGASLLDRRGELPLAERRTLRIARLIARALAALHERGLTHGALAPSRVLLNQRYSPTLVYYDVDPQPGAAGGPPSEEQAIAARLRFVAPERYGLIDAPVDGRADLYSLGALLYLCATGRAPFELDDDADILTHHATVPPEDPRAHNPELSPALAAIILRLLAKQPRRRYADVDALLSDLDRIPQLSDRAARGEPLALNTEGAPRSILDSGAFVGKEDEVRQLALHWQSARAGHGRAVHVQGPVGGGKSALVAGFVRRELDAARLVLEARCREPDARPLAPIRALLERYVRETITAEDDRRALALGFLDAAAAEAGAFLGRLSPFLAEVLGGRAALPDADVTPEQFHQTIALLLRLLVVRHEGAVLVLEDIEWLDPSSREVLRFLAPLLPTLPLLIVTTGGDGEAGREAVERISRESAVRYAGRVSVRPLSRSEVRALVSHSLGDAALEQPVIDALARSSRGSPAAVLDCVREVADAGRLSMSRGRWCADKSTLALLARAVSRDDTVSAALSRLDPRERVVLGAAAVIGARFPAALLIEVTQRDKDEIRDVIARARARAILARAGHDVYVFRGEALRRRLADELPAAARDEVHERVAVALEEELEEEREEERE
ncbi:MAG: AAA family ATPase, partial [Myxococcales bacterium]|nr:AAA family ATPase [Myxococcales bacterium]